MKSPVSSLLPAARGLQPSLRRSAPGSTKQGIPAPETTTEADHALKLLERLGLVNLIHKKVGDLSGGMKQRLALVIALLADPPIVILDEPTANLDVRAREDFLSLLNGFREDGKTLVFSSHRLEEVLALADRVLIIEGGRLVADSIPAQLSAYNDNQTMLKLRFGSDDWIAQALETLDSHGYIASKNGTGIWVEVIPLEKAKPISLLAEAGIPVDDFQID